jgi:hypothetical protein
MSSPAAVSKIAATIQPRAGQAVPRHRIRTAIQCETQDQATPNRQLFNGRSWPDMTHPVVGCMACQFDRQVYGIEIEHV